MWGLYRFQEPDRNKSLHAFLAFARHTASYHCRYIVSISVVVVVAHCGNGRDSVMVFHNSTKEYGLEEK